MGKLACRGCSGGGDCRHGIQGRYLKPQESWAWVSTESPHDHGLLRSCHPPAIRGACCAVQLSSPFSISSVDTKIPTHSAVVFYCCIPSAAAQLCSVLLSSLAAERNGTDMDSLSTIPKTFSALLSILLLFLATSISGMEIEREQLFPEILRDEAVARLHLLGKISDAESYLERTFLSPASLRASNLIISWMQDAGLTTWVDQVGNVHGRFLSMNPSAEALLIGSHLDTVIDAGIYDGSLGIICAISALKALKIGGKLEKLQRPVEVIAFSDEEGVRFQSTFLGSAGVAGILSASSLQISDKSGLTLHDVLKRNSYEATEESFLQLKYDPKKVGGYVEVHIEQGPVLEALGQPLGVVEGIAGQTRLRVTVKGSQGHAGTVPMHMRQDPMPAAAELIVLLEDLCKHPEEYLTYDGQCNGLREGSFSGSLVCTVGEISSWPSASNVIPGQVTFTVDLRAKDDNVREAIVFELSNQIYQTCDRRSVYCIIEHKHKAEAVHCDPGLSSQLKASAYSALRKISSEIQWDVPVLMSGAGHDAMAMSHLTKVGMLFVRCRGGVSHSPAEHVLDEDVWAAGLSLLAFIETNMQVD